MTRTLFYYSTLPPSSFLLAAVHAPTLGRHWQPVGHAPLRLRQQAGGGGGAHARPDQKDGAALQAELFGKTHGGCMVERACLLLLLFEQAI